MSAPGAPLPYLGLERDAKLGERAREAGGVLPDSLAVDLVQRLQRKLHEGSLAAAAGRLLLERAGVLAAGTGGWRVEGVVVVGASSKQNKQ